LAGFDWGRNFAVAKLPINESQKTSKQIDGLKYPVDILSGRCAKHQILPPLPKTNL